MSSELRVSLALWGSARRRRPGDSAYLVYAILMAGAVTVVPLVRWAWLLATDATVVAVLAPAAGATPALVITAACVVGALLTGRVRGPVVMAPFLAFALSRSPLPRDAIYARPLRRALTVGAALGGLAAGVVVLAWTAGGSVTALGAMASLFACVACGMMLAMLWLVGQAASERTIAVLVASVIAITTVSAALPGILPFTPLGWVALVYASAGLSLGAAALVALVLVGSLVLPALLRALRAETVLTHSLRWDAAASQLGMLDFSLAAHEYLPMPRVGRGIRSIRNVRSLPLRLALKDAVGVTRTPGRLAAGVCALLLAGCLVGLAIVTVSPWLGAVAGVVAYVGVGPMTDGIRHVVEASSSVAIYGAGDLAMLSGHALFPAALAVVLIGAAAAAAIVVTGPAGAVLPALVAAAAVGLGAVAARALGALKPPMPISLLSPIPTPMGDLAAAARLAWATDVALLTALIGAAAAVIASAPWLLAPAFALLGVVGARRWTRR